jgi:SAM-dependent methyltransferase
MPHLAVTTRRGVPVAIFVPAASPVVLPGSYGYYGAMIEKREFYRQSAVAGAYEAQRFGGASGGHVNARELAQICALLPAGGRVADIACGTGRLTAVLRQRGDTVIPCDTSLAMLRVAQGSRVGPVVQADAFVLPLAESACTGAASLRLLFHFADPRPLLQEFRRVVQPGGTLVCDTYSWSARALLPLGRRRWGAGVSTISRRRFRALVASLGWRVRAERPCFLFSPYLYRRLPLPGVLLLERLERRLPAFLLCRVFWALEANA